MDLPNVAGVGLAAQAAEVPCHVHGGCVKQLVSVYVQHPLQPVLFSCSPVRVCVCVCARVCGGERENEVQRE